MTDLEQLLHLHVTAPDDPRTLELERQTGVPLSQGPPRTSPLRALWRNTIGALRSLGESPFAGFYEAPYEMHVMWERHGGPIASGVEATVRR